MQPLKYVNMRLLMLCALMCAALQQVYAGSDDKLLNALRDRSLREIVDGLGKGELSAPGFCLDKQLSRDGGKLFRVILEKVRVERKVSVVDATKMDVYTRVVFDLDAYLGKYESYTAVLLRDCLKRLLLECVRGKMRAGCDLKGRREIEHMVSRVRLDPSALKVLFGREAKPEWIRGSLNLLETSQQLWESHGYHRVDGDIRGLEQVMDEQMRELAIPVSGLLLNYKPITLGVRMLSLEHERVIALGTLEFLKRGGDLSKVTDKDVRYFDLIMDEDTCMKFGFPPLRLQWLYGSDMLRFLGLQRVPGWLGLEPHWLAGVFE